jgi:hypothetical protein
VPYHEPVDEAEGGLRIRRCVEPKPPRCLVVDRIQLLDGDLLPHRFRNGLQITTEQRERSKPALVMPSLIDTPIHRLSGRDLRVIEGIPLQVTGESTMGGRRGHGRHWHTMTRAVTFSHSARRFCRCRGGALQQAGECVPTCQPSTP